MNPIHTTLRLITGMEAPIPIFVDTIKPLTYKSLVRTWSDKSMKYGII